MGGERACESRREAGMKSAVSRECVMGEKRGRGMERVPMDKGRVWIRGGVVQRDA
ncbi:hypothetical protein [Bartonella sp. MM55XZML]|uniref:hypothetical protein n=1 Tax=Bartonella sp. MM55XZML TaxID=3243552 RepID=UPI0035CF28EB